MAHLVEMEKEEPTQLSPESERAIGNFLRRN